ncbi:hypothetical protein MATL_G00086520 [Megalops atlanticus]|uniref:THD domain-containing protein n=1 Tax=Megalops atlanticus TaxID=7932 RepID=A0A9D3Q695_MEGAT|nr:hypothetical protein MATL_G00086520 [Megalops atlanticus]
MGRNCKDSVEIPCEAPELYDGENQTVLLLLKHCRETKRQECHARIAMGFLLLASLALLFFVQRSQDNSSSCKHVVPAPENGVHQRQVDVQNETPVAHLTGQHNKNPNQYIPWQHEMGKGAVRGFTYDTQTHALIIPRKGVYNVYMQFTYRKPSSLNCSQFLVLNPSVFKFSSSYPTVENLMVAYDTVGCDEQWVYKSIYSAGTFELEQGDKLMVNSTYPHLVDFTDDKKTYFGAYLI